MPRGDLVLVDLPPTVGKSGREQIGPRPAILLADDKFSKEIPVLPVVPLTSNQSALRFPLTVSVSPTAQNGLTQPSVILVFQLRAIDKRRILRNLGHLEVAIFKQVEEKIRLMLAL